MRLKEFSKIEQDQHLKMLKDNTKLQDTLGLREYIRQVESGELKVESSLNRVRKAWVEHDTGTITAFRDKENCGDGDTITKKEKESRNYKLRAILLGMGYGVTKVKGSWLENGGVEKGEASFFVVDYNDKGDLRKNLVKLGIKYDQDAVTYADAGGDYYVISTNECPKAWPGFGKINKQEKLGMPKFGKTGVEGFSRVNNRAFVFEGFHMSKLTDYGLTEWRGYAVIYDEYLGLPNRFKRE